MIRPLRNYRVFRPGVGTTVVQADKWRIQQGHLVFTVGETAKSVVLFAPGHWSAVRCRDIPDA